MCHNRSKIPHDSVSEEWLDPRECVELVQRFSGDVKCIHDLFLAIRINMLLRRGYGKTNFNFIFLQAVLANVYCCEQGVGREVRGGERNRSVGGSTASVWWCVRGDLQ